MKYRYSQIINALNWISVFAALVLFCYILYLTNHNFKYMRSIIYVIVLELIMIIGYNKEYRERYVELLDDYAVFNSFRIAGKVRTINVKYEDIVSVRAKTISLLGICAVTLKVKNVPWEIKVTWRMKKHKELFGNIYLKAKETGETEYIDEKLASYASDCHEK